MLIELLSGMRNEIVLPFLPEEGISFGAVAKSGVSYVVAPVGNHPHPLA